MFPPHPTEDPKEMVTGLWESLKRAAEDHWENNADVIPEEEGYLIRLYMKEDVPTGMSGYPVDSEKRMAT
jgi:hypothetical protein